MSRTLAIIAIAMWSAGAAFAGTDAPAPIPEQFRIGGVPDAVSATSPGTLAKASSIEKAQAALPGETYTVIAPLFLGAGNTLSYIRLANADDHVVGTDVTVIGSPSLRVYGTMTVAIPSKASLQYPITEILAAAGAPTTLPEGENGYALYVRSGGQKNLFQHVIYNSVNKFYENVSICTIEAPPRDYSPTNKFLINVHTSTLQGYPTSVYIHNPLSQSLDFSITVYESKTGAFKGAYSTSAPSNSTFSVPMSFLEKQIDWTPNATEFHANILVQGINIETARPVVGQYIYNETLQAYINMSQVCLVNH